MRALHFVLGACVVAGCAPGSGPESDDGDAIVPDGYTVTGNVPDSADIDQILAELPEGAFAVVGDATSPDVAVIHAPGSSMARTASAEFSAGAATCPDCVDPACGTLTRTIDLTLTHNSGINGETYGVSTFASNNFNAPTPSPASWSQNVGANQAISVQGTLATCGAFHYLFDVTGPDQLRVFVSADSRQGNRSGALNSDKDCQNFADAQGLGGTWMSWLSDATTSPSARYRNLTGKEYVLVGGDVVAKSFTDLTDGTLSGPINRDETGALLNGVPAWTGTQKSGAVVAGTPNNVTCIGFTSSSVARRGVIGTTGQTNATWTNKGATAANSLPCNSSAHVMCFEQDP